MRKESSQETDGAQEEGAALLGASASARLVARLGAGGQRGRGAAVRVAIARAMLEVVGERGWAATTVEAVVERAGSNRARFYASFAGKTACYESAYEAASGALGERLLGACAQGSRWPEGMHAALSELARFLAAEPSVARGLLVEVDAAIDGGAAVAAGHDQVVGRLSRAIEDRARRETLESRHPLPPFTSRFILDAIIAAVQRSLAEHRGQDFEDEVPGLLQLALAYHLGPAAAAAEVRRLCGGEREARRRAR